MNKKIFLYELKKIINIPVIVFVICIVIFKIFVGVSYNMDYDEIYNDTFDALLIIGEQEGNVEDNSNFNTASKINSMIKAIGDRETIQINAQNEDVYALFMPTDYLENINLYAEFTLPELINNTRWNLFFNLNTFNFIGIIAVLFFANIISKEKESYMDMIIKSSAVGEKTILKYKVILAVGISSILYNIFFLIDFIGSKLYKVAEDFGKPLSSLFTDMLSELTLGEFLIRFYIIGFLYTVFITLLVVEFSGKFSSSSLSLVFMMIFLICFIFADFIMYNNVLACFFTGNLAQIYTTTNLINIGNVIYYDMIFGLLYMFAVIIYILKMKRSFK